MQEKYKKSTIRFIQDLCPGWVKFRSISTQWEAKLITSQEAFTNEIDNIYFLWWVKEGWERLRDTDIWKIYYLRFDIDIKKQIQKAFWTDPSHQDILDTIKEIKRIISINQYFDEWKYIVYSWGWCHIYYKNSTWVELNETFNNFLCS